MRRQAAFFSLVVALLLSGCKSVPAPSAPTQSWPAHKSALQARAHFEIKGRVAVLAGQEGFTAGIRWVQSGTQSQIALEGPLGVGGVRVTTDGTTLTVINSHGERLDSDAASGELKARLGFDAPLASLRFWILGVPDPAATGDEVVDAEQRLTGLTQNGWQIEYADYTVVKGEWLPGRMTLKSADVRVRLVVDRWDS